MKYLAYIFILLLLIIYCFSIYIARDFYPFFQISSQLTPTKSIVDNTVSITGFILTALGFIFVAFQVTALAKQINKQEEQFHKDSEFKIFLEATKMLTAFENKDNATAQISAMYILYDYAKKYPNNIEKVIHILNRFPVLILLT